MPTYDAKTGVEVEQLARDMLADAKRHGQDNVIARALLAATQEVERLTRENERLDNVAKALAGSHARLREENDALSSFLSLLDDWRWSEMDWHDIRDSDLAQRIVDAFAAAERAFSAIRHAAGLNGGSQ